MKLFNFINKGEDEKLEFDNRYSNVDKIKSLRKHFKHDLLKIMFKQNTEIIHNLQKENRAEAMKYYDEIFTTDKILVQLKKLKKQGKKIIGTYCNMVPEELIYAAGAIPIRLCSGCYDSVKPAEQCFPRDSCPLIKSSLGFAIMDSGFYNLCDATIIPATCDGKKKLGEILNDLTPVWMMDLPQSKERAVSKKYWLSETRILRKRLEELTNRKIGNNDLKEAVVLLHKRHDVIRRFLQIRKSEIPAISGRDAFLVMQACFYGNIHDWITNTEKLCDELEKSIKQKKFVKPKNSARILLTGAPVILPNFKIPGIIESFNANITIDETCSGSQYIYNPVEVDEWTDEEMMHAISESYLMPCVCPCFIKSDDRIDKLINMIKEYKIDGVIYHTLRLCLLYDVEAIKIKDVLEQHNIPFLQINTDYSKEDTEQIKTRIEAFIEIIHHRR